MSRRSSFAATIVTFAILMLLWLLGSRYAAAQTATSTDEASTTLAVASSTVEATTTDETPTITENAPSTAEGTTTDDTVVASSTESASSTPVTGESTTSPATVATTTPQEPTTSDEVAQVATSSVDIQSIASMEETYHQQTGHYLQILPGNQLPNYESGSVAGNLGQNIPDNVQVDIYQAPGGDGYQISYQEDGVFYSVARGSEASSRTYTITIPAPAATATSTSS